MLSTSEVIRALLERGLRQAQIARRVGVPQSRLSKWQAGEIPRAADDALKLRSLLEEVTAVAEGEPS
jgi:predicted XRE-type DNA-binding protein